MATRSMPAHEPRHGAQCCSALREAACRSLKSSTFEKGCAKGSSRMSLMISIGRMQWPWSSKTRTGGGDINGRANGQSSTSSGAREAGDGVAHTGMDTSETRSRAQLRSLRGPLVAVVEDGWEPGSHGPWRLVPALLLGARVARSLATGSDTKESPAAS